MAVASQRVGFVADNGDGALRRVLGTVLSTEGSNLILGVPAGVIVSEVALPTFTVEVNSENIDIAVVQVPTSECSLEPEGPAWQKCAGLPAVENRVLMKGFWSSDVCPTVVTTDSMQSAGSRSSPITSAVRRTTHAKPPPPPPRNPFAMGAGLHPADAVGNAGGHDGDDENMEADPTSAMMSQLAQMLGGGGWDEEEVPGMPDLQQLFSVPKSSAPPPKIAAYQAVGPAGSTTEGLPAWFAEAMQNVSPDSAGKADYEKMKSRFSGGHSSSASMRYSPSLPPQPPSVSAAGKGPAAATAAASGADSQAMMMLMMQMMLTLQSKQKEAEGTGATAGGKALRRLHAMRGRVEEQPEPIVAQYLKETMEDLGAEPGDAWQLWHRTEMISWGQMAGLHRVHYHLSHILTMMLRGQTAQAEAYMVQLLRAVHQVSLDGGSWSTAALRLPKKDPLYKVRFGATEEELETCLSFNEAMKKISGQRWEKPESQDKDSKDKKAEGGGKGDGQPG